LRYFNPFGPRSFNPANKFNAYSSVVGIFLNQYKEGKPLTVTGDGSQKRDFIHVKDVAVANYKASISQDYLNTSYNVGSGATVTILELAKMISSNYVFLDKREGEADITWANIDKIKSELNWSPQYHLADFIQLSK
jgi:UDP-glucose 4-epimerase